MHRWGPLAVATLVAVMLTGLVAIQAPRSSSCRSLPITVASSEEKSQLLSDLAANFNATHPMVGNQCVTVRVVRKASGAAEQALAAGWNEAVDGPRPDAWSPAAVTWILLLDQQLTTLRRSPMAPVNSPSLCWSPLVIGMPLPMAQAIEASGQPIGWSDLLGLAGDPKGWSRYGHPEYGAFQLAKTNPLTSTSGLHALIGTYFAASGRSSNLTPAVLSGPTVVSFVTGVERAVVHYGDSVSNFLLDLQAADDANRALTYVSAIAMEEKEVWDYNQGNPTGDPAKIGQHPLPKVPLVAIYPKEGTLKADHPYAILDAPWVTPAKRSAAQEFLQYLQAAPAQARFQTAGFRDQRGIPGLVISSANGMRPELPGAYLQLPPAPVIQAVQASWSSVRKRARVLLVIDSSALASGLDARRFAQSVAAGFKQLAGDDQAGAWVLPGPGGASALPYVDLVSVAPLRGDAATLEGDIGALKPSTGRIALYSSLQAAVTAMATNIDPSRINAVLLISAGRSTDPGDTARFATLSAVSAIAGQIPGVHVFTIAVGKNPDRANLHLVALEGKGASYDASDPTSVSRALAAVISNF
jgi:Ca-activated chloride channel homolog